MTVDVEDYFQVSAFERYIERDHWDSTPGRLEPHMDRILALFDSKGTKATFFTLGWIAKRYPGMVKRIVKEGHELASHGWGHERVTTLDSDQFEADIRRAKLFLEDLGGVEVAGYRAPSYSINGQNHKMAHAALSRQGYRYSSSIAPIDHDLYGWPEASPDPFPVAGGELLEIPISTTSVGSRNIACGGGGWFRLYPYRLSRRLASRVQNDGRRYIFYFHPWEFDAQQPRLKGIDLRTRFRHYINLSRMEDRVSRLLEDFSWDRMDRVFERELAGITGSCATQADSDATPIAASF